MLITLLIDVPTRPSAGHPRPKCRFDPDVVAFVDLSSSGARRPGDEAEPSDSRGQYPIGSR